MREYKVTLPLTKEELKKYEIGDVLYLTGYIYTARDAAHKRFQQLVEEGKPLPVDYFLCGSMSHESRENDGLHRSYHQHAHGRLCEDDV